MNYLELDELARHVCGVDDNADIEESIYELFNTDLDTFGSIVEKLLPLCDTGQSGITGKRYRGFSYVYSKKNNTRVWLLKTEIINSESEEE